jgi:hypothetical protein
VLVLSGDVHQAAGDLRQRRERDEGVVEVDAVSPGSRHDPADDELCGRLGVVDPRDREARPHLLRVGGIEFEEGLDGGGVRARADDLGRGAPPEDQVQRVDQDRLARARLTGDDREPGAELQGHAVDDREVLDGQAREHGAPFCAKRRRGARATRSSTRRR